MQSFNLFHQNYTILVNWKEHGFGCAKACSYCNWRSSPLLPQGAQSPEAISAFIRQCKKSFITISGGGEPLYRYKENHPKLRSMADLIWAAAGFKGTLLKLSLEQEVVYGNEKAIQPGIQD